MNELTSTSWRISIAETLVQTCLDCDTRTPSRNKLLLVQRCRSQFYRSHTTYDYELTTGYRGDASACRQNNTCSFFEYEALARAILGLGGEQIVDAVGSFAASKFQF